MHDLFVICVQCEDKSVKMECRLSPILTDVVTRATFENMSLYINLSLFNIG